MQLNDFQIEALNEYAKDNSDINLELFTLTINPAFKLTKKSKQITQILINKLDGTEIKLKPLINYLQPDIKTPIYSIPDKNATSNNDIKSYLKVDKNADKERKTSIFTALLGDYKVEGTLAWSLITNLSNLSNPNFLSTFTSNDVMIENLFSPSKETINPQPAAIYKWCKEITGKDIVNFYDIYIIHNFILGGRSTYKLVYNKSNGFNIIDNKSHDSNYATLSQWNTVNPNVPMSQVFQGMEGARRSMK